MRPASLPKKTATSQGTDALKPNCALVTGDGMEAPADARRAAIPDVFLHCVRSGDGRLTAGLHTVADAKEAKRSSNAVQLTDVCDQLMVDAVVRGRGGSEHDRVTALLGIAWRRIQSLATRPIRCWRPADLRPYTVRMQPDGSETETVVVALAGSMTAACAAAATAVFDHAARTAEAVETTTRTR